MLTPKSVVPILVASALLALAVTASASSAEVIDRMPLPDLPDGKPNGLVGAAAVMVDGKSYIIGGRYADGHFSDSIYEYDHAAKRFTEVAKLPPVPGAEEKGRQKAAATLLNGKIVIFGGATIVSVTGLDPSDPARSVKVPKSLKDVIEFDPATKEVRTLTATLPVSSWGHAAVTIPQLGKEVVYLFGGFSFDATDPANIRRLDSIVKYDPSLTLGQMKHIAELPYAVQDHGAAVLNARVYLFGGLSQHDNVTNPCPQGPSGNQPTVCNTDRILLFNPDAEGDATVLTSRMPYRGQFIVAAVVEGKAYLPGALLPNGAPAGSIVEFDAKKASPVRVLTPTLPRALFAHVVTTDGRTITMFGGESSLVDLTADITTIDPRVTPPWPPRNAAATSAGGAVTLSWEPPAYDGDSAVTAYRIVRVALDGVEERLADVTTLTYEDTTAQPGTQYTYRVAAINSAGDGGAARATLTSASVPPGAVGDLQAFAGNGEVILRWTPPTFTGGANLTGYRVYRDGGATPVATLPPGAVEWRDAGLQNGVEVAYTVRAVNVKGEGASGTIARATPIEVPSAPRGVALLSEANGVRVRWQSADAPVKSYVVLRGTSPSELVKIATLGATDTAFLDESVERGRRYYFAVAAVNDVGESPPSSPSAVSLVSKPGAPRGVLATGLEGAIKVSWQPPADTGEAEASTLTYSVLRDGRIIAADVAATNYTDRGILPGRTHAYTVTAYNGILSDASAPASAAAKIVQNKLPVATVAVLTSVVDAGDDVLLDASLSRDDDGEIVEYVFDFGDGSTPVRLPTASATHAYANNGTYTISLFVVDDRGGESDLALGSVVVGEPPAGPPTTPTEDTGVETRPGSATPKVPGPGVALVLAGLAIALLARRVHPRK